jgi:hypothetical protein
MLSFLYIEKFPSEERRSDKVSSWVYDATCNLHYTRQTCLNPYPANVENIVSS